MNKEIENTYQLIKNKMFNHEIYRNVKDYSKERNKVTIYFEIEKLLSKTGKEYGKKYNEEILDICVSSMSYLKTRFGTWRVPN